MTDEYGRSGDGVKRAYSSPYRAEQAARTRRRLLDVAIELFSTQGYVATTVDDIARAAGVSRPTVFAAVGNKRELIKQARDVALVGDDEPVPMPQRPWVNALRDEPNPAGALGIYAEAMRRIHDRAAALERAITAAADADADLRALAATSHQQRHRGCQLIADALAAKGPLREGLTTAGAADLLFAHASPDVYWLLTIVRGWRPDRYQTWLHQTLVEQLLPGADGSRRRLTTSRRP